MSNFLSFAPAALFQLFADAPQIIAIWNAATSKKSATEKIKAVLPLSAPILEKIGSQLFPSLASELHVIAGAISLNWTATQYTQEALNLLVTPSPNLKVDGVFGPKTLAAVHAFQAAHGYPVTGFLSDIEDALIVQLLAPKVGG